MIKAQRGTIDILPQEVKKWQQLENTAREVCRLHNVEEIRTPIFEATELFARSSGESSDIVNKEMYTFLDKGERSITLRPEGTAGVVRAIIEHGLIADALPIKLFYIAPSFRYEKPQNGRLREFRQFGIENFGSNEPKMIAETVSIGYDFLNSIGIKNIVCNLNSLGCETCKREYTEKLKEYFSNHKEKMCEDCQRRLVQNPLRILDCKVESCREIIKDAPRISEILCENCKNYLKNVEKMLKLYNIPYKIDESIIRGLDYYTGVVFEFITSDIEGSSAVVGAGGQYNNLVEQLGGQNIPAVGFAFGMERLLMLLEKQNEQFGFGKKLDCYVINTSHDFDNIEFGLVNNLRQNGFSVDCDLMERSFRANFKYANKLEAEYVLVLGEDEVKQNSVSVKNMKTGEQKLVGLDKVIDYLK